MALAPCHALFQFYVSAGRLSCQLYQRSADIFLGVPFNIASYALLTQMIARVTDLEPGEFIHTFGDAHLYNNHLQEAELQLSRKPKASPTVENQSKSPSVIRFSFEDFELSGYDPHPHIKAPVSVLVIRHPLLREKIQPMLSIIVATAKKGVIGCNGQFALASLGRSAAVSETHHRTFDCNGS